MFGFFGNLFNFPYSSIVNSYFIMIILNLIYRYLIYILSDCLSVSCWGRALYVTLFV